jgi:hypothetical protein
MNLKPFTLSLFTLVASLGGYAQQSLYNENFLLSDVTINQGQFKHAQDLNIQVLLQYDVDRLLAPYLKEAGLTAKAESYPNWDGLDGHIGGHYLSALAINYASTGNAEVKQRLDYMIAELKRCQDANSNGYVGGVPNSKELWKEITSGNIGAVWTWWVPWYNVHKTYAGLRDAWLYTGSTTARDMFYKFCDWGVEIISHLDDKQMEAMLDNEFGGMDEIYADAYQMTGDKRYLTAARRFSHHWLLDSMAAHVDNLDNKHANTQVPKVVGYQRIAELTGDDTYTQAARFFWETVVYNRSLAIGGNSRREHFASKEDCRSYAEDREGPESCNTYNMLKLTEGLFRMEHNPRYVDFYERALFNHILSTQHPEHGGYVYFTSARPAHYRVYSQPNQAMWCCVGSGMENHGKYGEFIYTHSNDTLRVNLFIASTLNWKEKGVTITQDTDFPYSESTRFTVNTKGSKRFSLALRHPAWCEGLVVKINGKTVDIKSTPSSYFTIDRKWKNGDVVELSLPMHVSIEEMPNMPNYLAILRGPIVLGAEISTDNLDGLVADDSRWGHIANGPLVSVFDTPILIGSHSEILDKLKGMQPVEGKPMHFTVPGLFTGKYANIELRPFSTIHDCRYMMYWLSMTNDEYSDYQANERQKEEAKLALDARTVDAVNTGEQQPEADHFMESQNTERGYNQDEPWRHAFNGGYFSFLMNTAENNDLQLMVRYWGNEQGNRSFNILVDDKVIATENIQGRWNESEFKDVTYDIPSELLKGKKNVRVKFAALPDNYAGGVYYVRLVKPE